MKNHLDGGEAILEAFRSLGIDYIMSSPGSEWGAVWEALARQTVTGAKGPTYLSCWHETLAVDMAIGYTLATGRMQAVMLHAGVGLLQGSMGIHSALIQNVPMIVLSGEALTYGEQADFDPGAQWYQNLSVVGGPQTLVAPITKWASQVPSSETLYESIIRAGLMAQRSPMGPVYLNVPIETQLKEWSGVARTRIPHFAPPRAPLTDIERVAALLTRARHPIIITESAGRQAECYAALIALAEALAIPVIETPSALFSNFPKDNSLYAGPSLASSFEVADHVLVVRSRAPWYPPGRRPPHATVVLIDENPYREHMAYQNVAADIVLDGDATFTLQMLLKIAQAGEMDDDAIKQRRAYQTTRHAQREDARRAALAAAGNMRPIDPTWLCAAMSEILPADAVYVDETVTHRSAIEIGLKNGGPQSYFKVLGGLGQGLGHALGIKLAMPERLVVCLIGDGSLLYNPIPQSLGLSQQVSLPILIVIFNNKKYLAMRNNHLGYYPNGVAKQHELFYGETIGGPDFAELGAPFGGWGRTVGRPEDLMQALGEALHAVREGRTAILNVELHS